MFPYRHLGASWDAMISRMVGLRLACCLSLIVSIGCGRFDFDRVNDGDAGTNGDASNAPDGGDAPGDGPVTDSPYNLVFVTSTSTRLAEVGGLAGADAMCNQLAADAGLRGTYVAWLSDASTSAASRLSGARGWVRYDGKPVVDTVADLLAGRILHPILLTETGVAVTGQFGIITATSNDGTLAEDCSGFTSTSSSVTMMTGIAGATFSTWTQNLASNCSQSLPLYCFGVDRSVPLTYTPATGRRAFVTAASWAPSGGVTAADAACQAAADARALGGSWRALIATTTATAASRFSASGAPWVRLDGIALASTPDVLLDGEILDAPLNYTETGQYRGSNPANTGATSTTALGTAASTCLDWTSSAMADSQRVGLLNSITLYFSTPIFQTCSSGGGQLYCLEP